jgi:diaminopimelate decarboxylase
MMNLSSWSIRNPIPSVMLFIMLTLGGLLGFSAMKVQQFPDLDLPTDVCGNTTHTRDFLGRDLRLPALAPGDLLALRDVGAYGYAMSSHFLNRPRPAEVVCDGEEVVLSTRRETFADLLSTWVTS